MKKKAKENYMFRTYKLVTEVYFQKHHSVASVTVLDSTCSLCNVHLNFNNKGLRSPNEHLQMLNQLFRSC